MKNQRLQMIIALHGFERSIDERVKHLIKFRTWVDDFCSKFTIGITDFSCYIDSKDSKLKHGKNYNMKSRAKILQQELEKGKINQVDLYSLPEGVNISPAFDWKIFTSIGQDLNKVLAHLEVGISIELIEGYSSVQIETIIKELTKFVEEYLDINYGYAFIMPRRFFPNGYVIGLAGGGPSELVYDANSWQSEGSNYCGKLLRNVFPITILNSEHLHIQLGDITLKDWIEQSEERGIIEKLEQNLYLWSIYNEDIMPNAFLWDTEKVCQVRNSLKEYRIFPFQHME